MKNVILLAPPAAGKGTVAKMLCDDLGYISISTGDILREESKTNEHLRKIMKAGKLVDDDTVFKLLKAKLNKLGNTPYILDGFPRTVNQAVMYDELLQNIKKELGVVIYLDIDEKELIERITTRLVCPNCKRSYSTRDKNFYPKKKGFCDDCNIELIRREDDKEEIFDSRYQEYLNSTAPLIDFYDKKEVLYRVDDIDANDIYKKISSLVKNND